MSLDLGDLTQGEQAIDIAMGNIPNSILLEKELLDISNKIYYKTSGARLNIHSGGFPEMTMKFPGNEKSTYEKELIKKAYDEISYIIDEYNEEKRRELIKRRAEIINQLK